ncbi:unnamed protein product [Choristocarpus tenellus]
MGNMCDCYYTLHHSLYYTTSLTRYEVYNINEANDVYLIRIT